MVSLAFHLFVAGTVMFALMTVVVHSFVADSSLFAVIWGVLGVF